MKSINIGDFWKKLTEKLSPKAETTKTKSYSLTLGPRPLSLDINSDFCCLLKTTGSYPKLTLLQLDVCPVPKGCIEECKLADPQLLQSTLNKFLIKNKIKKQKCAFTLAGSLTINKQLNISKNMTAKQLQAKVDYEAKHAFPDDDDAIYVDYINAETNNNHHQLDIIATHKSDLDPFLQTMRKAHLKPSVVDIDYYALDRIYPLLVNNLPPEKRSLPNAAFYLTSQCFLMIVNEGSEFIYTHRQLFHSETISATLDAIINQKEDVAINPTDLELIGKNISHLLQFYFSGFNNSHIDNLILTGPLAIIPGLANHITQYTTINTVIAALFEGIENKLPEKQKELIKYAPIFVFNLSLAMRGN